jgi:hypothetical protein
MVLFAAGCHALLPLDTPHGDTSPESDLVAPDRDAADHADGPSSETSTLTDADAPKPDRSPDQALKPDQTFKLDTSAVDQAPGADMAPPLCKVGMVLFDKSFATQNGWDYSEPYPQPSVTNPGVAEYPNTQKGGSTFNYSNSGLFVVPDGCRIRIHLTRSFTAGKLDVRTYQFVCKNDQTCSKGGSIGCAVLAGTGVGTCGLLGMSGKLINTLRLERPDAAGATATASHLKIVTE